MTKLSQQRGSQRSKFRTQLKKKGWPEGDAFDAEVSRLITLWEQGEAYSVQSPPECFAQVGSADPAASGLCHEAPGITASSLNPHVCASPRKRLKTKSPAASPSASGSQLPAAASGLSPVEESVSARGVAGHV